MRQFWGCSAIIGLLLLSACQARQENGSIGNDSAALPAHYLRLGDIVLKNANDLKDLATQAGTVAGTADLCRLPTDMMDKEIRELGDSIPHPVSSLPKGFFTHTFLATRKNVAAKAERGGCDDNSRQNIERLYADQVIVLQSPQLRSWILKLRP